MAKKQFKAESKKLMDMMINSIYTHKEIFLRELISNASDALDKLYFRSLTDDSITLARSDYQIKLSIDKEKRLLTIEDNGIGIDKKYQNKIFTKFVHFSNIYSKNESSTGLGLTITKELVKLHKGKISLKSEVNKGTTFKVELNGIVK